MYPILGILAHFALLILIVDMSTLADGASAYGDAAKAQNVSADFLSDDRIFRISAFGLMILSVAVAWFVRRGLWRYYEHMPSESSEEPNL